MSGVETTAKFYADLEAKFGRTSGVFLTGVMAATDEDDGRWHVFGSKWKQDEGYNIKSWRLVEHRRFKEFRVETVDAVFTDVDSAITALLLL